MKLRDLWESGRGDGSGKGAKEGGEWNAGFCVSERVCGRERRGVCLSTGAPFSAERFYTHIHAYGCNSPFPVAFFFPSGCERECISHIPRSSVFSPALFIPRLRTHNISVPTAAATPSRKTFPGLIGTERKGESYCWRGGRCQFRRGILWGGV